MQPNGETRWVVFLRFAFLRTDSVWNKFLLERKNVQDLLVVIFSIAHYKELVVKQKELITKVGVDCVEDCLGFLIEPVTSCC